MTLVGSPPGIPVRTDPAVAEAAVWISLTRGAVPSTEALHRHRRRTDRAYELADGSERDAAFGGLALVEFEELGLAEPLRRALGERPVLASGVRALLLGEARGRQNEGVTVEPGGEHLGLRVDVARFGDPASLLAWARHVLGHAEDTLDPDFFYERGWEARAAGSVAAGTHARLHRLWDVTVDARLAHAGHLDEREQSRHRERIAADIAGVGPGAVDAVMQLLWDGPRPSFPELFGWAARPVELVAVAAPDHARQPRPDRCPLCRFPSDDVLPPGPSIAAAVAQDYPAWRPEFGLCGRCTDRYRFAGQLGGRT